MTEIKTIDCICGCNQKKIIATCNCGSEMSHISHFFVSDENTKKGIKCGDPSGYKCQHCGYEVDLDGNYTVFKTFVGPKKVY